MTPCGRAGFIMFVSGLAVHKKRLIRDSAAFQMGPARVAPTFTSDGVGLVGSF